MDKGVEEDIKPEHKTKIESKKIDILLALIQSLKIIAIKCFIQNLAKNTSIKSIQV